MTSQDRLAGTALLATLATSLCLHAMFHGAAWALPVVVALVLVEATTTTVRRTRIPAGLAPILAAVVVMLWLTGWFAHEVAPLGFLPGPAALARLDAVARAGFRQANGLSVPVPDHPGIVLLATVAMALVMLVVDLFGVVIRRVALAGIPLLVVVTVATAVSSHGIGLLAFLVTSVGFLVLLYVDTLDRVRRWGGNAPMPVATDRYVDPELVRSPGALGRRLGAMALGAAVVVPVLIPGLHGSIERGHGHGSGHGSGSGGSAGTGSIVTLNPLVSVGSDLRDPSISPVLTYRSTDANPSYLQLTTLNVFNGTTFSAAPLQESDSPSVTSGLANPQRPGPLTRTDVLVSNGVDLHWLPVPLAPVSVNVSAAWRQNAAQGTIFSTTQTISDQQYTVTSDQGSPSVSQLQSSPKTTSADPTDLATPAVAASVHSLTARLTAGATSPYQKALAIQSYLTSSAFHYSVNVHLPNGPSALPTFLFQTRTGFCQQFATAMAVMARIAGIPSRVAVGFTRGNELKPQEHQWFVTTRDAHAWPELYFPSAGWVAFEPTPRGDGQAVAPPYATTGHSATTGTGSGSGASSPSTTNPLHSIAGLRPRPGVGTVPVGGDTGESHALVTTGSGGVSPLWWELPSAVVVLALLGSAGAPALLRVRLRRRRQAVIDGGGSTPAAAVGSAAAVGWQELRDTAVDLGLGWPAGRSPRQEAAALRAAVRIEIPGLDTLVGALERAAYASPDGEADARSEGSVAAALASSTARLRLASPASTRRRALALPRSTVLSLTARLRAQRLRVRLLAGRPAAVTRERVHRWAHPTRRRRLRSAG